MSKFMAKYKWGGKKMSSHLYHQWDRLAEGSTERNKGLRADIEAALNGRGYIPGMHPLSPWVDVSCGDVL